jgi:hypothetical protein
VLALAATLALLLSATGPARADIAWVETQQGLRIIFFDPTGAYLVPHVTQSFLAGLDAQRRRFDYVPDGGVSVLLEDFSDRGNAAAIAAPRNRIFFEFAPSAEPYETVSSGERYAWTAMHELTHMSMNDRANGSDAWYRHFFHGKVDVDAAHPESLLYYYLTVPRATAPRWYHEGGAVFTETWMNGGLGRAQGGYDETVFRAMVKDDAKFYDPLGLVSKGTEIDFKSGGNAYLYGTRFMTYLAYTYGPDRLLDWWRRDDASRRYYADDFQRVFGLPLEESWRRWVKFEHDFQRQNLHSVQEHPLSEHRDLTHRGLGAVSRMHASRDGTRLYAAVKYPGQIARLVAIDRASGSVSPLREVKGVTGYIVTSLAYDQESDTLFYTSNNQSHRNLEALELRTGRNRQLLKGARIGDLAYNRADRSLWGLRLNNGFVILVRVPYPYREWQALYTFPSAERAFDLDLSPDGRLASVSVSGPGPRPGAPQVTEVRVYDTDALARGEAPPLHVLQMGASVPEGFVFSPDGRFLFGSSYYTGVSNIYRYELATEKLDAVSNAEIGFFRPLPLDPERIIVLRYSAEGFVPTELAVRATEDLSAVTFLGEQVAAKYPSVQSWVAATPDSMPYEPELRRQGAYRPLALLSLDSLIPMVQGYKDAAALGLSARFADPMGFDALAVDASYSPDHSVPAKERLHLDASLRHERWTAGAEWNGADFYDLFGPTKRSRAGWNTFVGFDQPIVFDLPERLDFRAKVAYYGELDALPNFQNIVSPSKNLFTADLGFFAVDTRASPGAVDAETGHLWSLNAHGYGAAGEFLPSLTATYDFGIPLPLDHSSLWLRSGASLSDGERTDPLANVYLGGFGNNYVDSGAHGSAQRYRELLSLPGFALDALHGRSLVKTTLEWCLPPWRFEALGTPGFYASWARPELFIGAIETDPDSRSVRQGARDVGAQLDFQLQVMHRMPMMLSIGVARGFGGGGLGEREFMISLQLL